MKLKLPLLGLSPLWSVPAAESKTQTLPANPALGRIPKQTWRESRERWKQDVCMHPVGVGGEVGKGGTTATENPEG